MRAIEEIHALTNCGPNTDFPPIEPEFKKLWLEALRSGVYKQTNSALRRGIDKFCCLGIACDISDIGDWDTWGTISDGYLYRAPTVYPNAPHCSVSSQWDSRESYPPALVRQTIKLDDDAMYAVAKLNDSHCTFEEIALWIEHYL